MLITFALFDATGAPLTGATPTFAQYLSAITGVDLGGSAPAITEVGGGIYGFDAVLSGEGIAYYIDGGASAAPQYLGGGQGDNGVVVLPFYANDGTPAGVCTASIDTYEDGNGNPVTPPTLNSLNNTGLFSFLPLASEVAAHVSYMVSSNKNPTRYFGQLEASGGAVADTTPPLVHRVEALSGTVLRVIYSEAVVMTSGSDGALNLANYMIAGLSISGVTHETDRSVRLVTSPQTPGNTYTLVISNVADIHGNVIA
jgi:hypothetical protein